jgi:hypothetical protein
MTSQAEDPAGGRSCSIGGANLSSSSLSKWILCTRHPYRGGLAVTPRGEAALA